MTNGILITNNNNQVLISSDTRNLHFIGKYPNPSEILQSSDYYGGVRRYRYRITCSNTTPVVFFSNPIACFCAVSRVTNIDANTWDIEVIRSETSNTTPTLYIFADPRASTASDTYGVLVYKDDGSASFDSRLRPLTVTGAAVLTHPNDPKPSYPYELAHRDCGSNGAGAGGFFAPTNYNNFAISGNMPANPMFSYYSLAQAEKQVHYHDEDSHCDSGFDPYGVCFGTVFHDYWNSDYWCFYRGGISFSGTTIVAGWIAVTYACYGNHYQNSQFLGIVDTGSSAGGAGSWPYSNETINLSNNTVLIGDASRYD